MAGEISATISLIAKKGTLSVQRALSPKIDMAGTHYSAGVQSIATTAAGVAVTIGAGVATLGVSMFINLDAANYVELGVQVAGTFYPLVKLKAGEAWPLRLSPGVTLYARGNTAAVNLELIVLED